MTALLIGDFRIQELQYYQSRTKNEDFEYHYLLEDSADYSWFDSNATAQLPLMPLDSGNIIVMLGFNDCVRSCVWPSFFNINSIASKYASLVNELAEKYQDLNFYLCSIGPVDSGYAFDAYKNDIISEKLLNTKIKAFNRVLKNKCKANYLDCYTYLNTTSFNTHDGVRYDQDTCAKLAYFIAGSVKNYVASSGSSADFIPRLTEPNKGTDGEAYWVQESKGGYNPFGARNADGDVLPNCTSYAWGRFYELIGERPKLSTSDAENWWGHTQDGYKRGQDPSLGAIICWRKGKVGDDSDGAGHVAVVEQINDDGSIVTSESGYNSTTRWWTTKRTNTNGNWGAGSEYTFQGFIYCPTVVATPVAEAIDKSSVISKDEYLSEAEMTINAKYIWNYLGSRGWSVNAVAGMLGNMQTESTINPGLHERGGGSGFGLVQWTPKYKLTDWTSSKGYADSDIDGQLERLIWEKDNNIQYYKRMYKYTFKEFSVSTDDPYTLACAFVLDYERPDYQGQAQLDKRGKNAEKWYKVLAPMAPTEKVFEEKFILNNFKIDELNTNNIKASFIIKNGKSANYKLLSASNKQLSKQKIELKNSDKLQSISFKVKKLKPNTKYKLVLEVISKLGDGKNKKTITFTTPQAFPDAVQSVKLSCKEEIISTDSTFNLKVTKPKSIGYWGKNSCGYTEQLFVNNKSVKTININCTRNLNNNFKIKNKFNYNLKTGDTIQIGIRTWAKSDKGTKIYNEHGIVMSDPVCILNKSIRMYLNK